MNKRLSSSDSNHGGVSILGVRVDRVSMEQAVAMVEKWLEGDEDNAGKDRFSGNVGQLKKAGQYQIATPNPEHIMLAQKDAVFKRILNHADLSIADGVGILWAARFLGQPLPERVTGTDLMVALCERAPARGWRVYFLGGAEGVAEKAATILRERFPGLQVVGVSSADPGVSLDNAGKDTKAQREQVEQMVQPEGRAIDLLFVAYGAPVQEKWIAKNLPHLPVRVAMGVGGGLDFVAGVQKRAPRLLRQLSLEWLWRLITDPRRIQRIFTAVVLFPLAVARYRLKMVQSKR